MEKRYRVTLTELERVDWRKLVSTGKAAAQKRVRARILLVADQSAGGASKSDPEMVASLGCGRASVERVRKRCVEEGLEVALTPKPSQRVDERKMDGNAEAHLIALACRAAPEGRARWTRRLLGDQMVALEHGESVSFETVRRVLKKTNFSLGCRRAGVCRKVRRQSAWRRWKRSWRCTIDRTMPSVPWYAWTNAVSR